MFCCNNIINKWFAVAIKKPNNKSAYVWTSLNQKNQFDECNDINTWIFDCFSKTQQKWKNQLLYNDQLPDHCQEYYKFKKIDNNGHSKGILVWNERKIGWLIHSIPKFPCVNMDQNYKIPEIDKSQLEMGQSAFYIELDVSYKEFIIDQLSVMNVQVYYMSDYLNTLDNTLMKKFNNKEPKFNGIVLKEKTLFDNTKINHYAKNNKFNNDLYEIMCLNNPSQVIESMTTDSITNVINNTNKKTHMYTQTWLNGRVKKLPDSSNVSHINELKEWKTNIDHSKWAISIKKKNTWYYNNFYFKYKVCIGDLNRVDTQLKRSGGIILIENKSLWSCFNNIIKSKYQLINEYTMDFIL